MLLLFNAGLVFATSALILGLSLRTRFARAVWRHSVLPLVLATSLWSIEYGLQLIPAHAWPRLTFLEQPLGPDFPELMDHVLNTLASICFALAGWSLFRLKGRAHPDLLPAGGPTGMEAQVYELAGRPATMIVVLVASLVLLAVSASSAHSKDVREQAQALTAATGMFILGAGLFRELTRARKDPVAVVCCLSILAYAALQVFQVVDDPRTVRYAVTRLLAIVFKVSFAVSLGAFWAIASESARASLEQVGVGEVLARHLAMWDRLHNTIGGASYSLAFTADGASRRLGPTVPEAVRAKLKDLADQARDLNNEIRALVNEGPKILEVDMCPQGLPIAMTRRLQILRSRMDSNVRTIEIELRTSPEPFPRLDRCLESGLYGIALEALNNIEKHSHAQHVFVMLRRDEAGVHLLIEDDGDGLTTSMGAGRPSYGIATMERLAQALHSDIALGPGIEGRGTRVRVVPRNGLPGPGENS